MAPLALKICTFLLTETSKFMYQFTKRLQPLGDFILQTLYSWLTGVQNYDGMQISVVFCFSKFQKVGKFAASIERPKAESVSASGAMPPGSLTRGSVPEPHSTPRNPHYRLAFHARYGLPPTFKHVPLSNSFCLFCCLLVILANLTLEIRTRMWHQICISKVSLKQPQWRVIQS